MENVFKWSDDLLGVPQSSVLGPCLFLIYINNIDDAVDCAVTLMRKFADDTKIAAVTDTVHQFAKFQQQINCLAYWA